MKHTLEWINCFSESGKLIFHRISFSDDVLSAVQCDGYLMNSSSKVEVSILASVSFWPLLIIELVARAVPERLIIRLTLFRLGYFGAI